LRWYLFLYTWERVNSPLVARRGTRQKLQRRPIVVYCADGPCEDGRLVQGALARIGHKEVMLFKDSWEEWIQQKLPVEKSL